MILLHDVRQLENFIWGSETTKSMVKSIIRGGGVVVLIIVGIELLMP